MIREYDYPAVTYDCMRRRQRNHGSICSVERHINELLTSGEKESVKCGLLNVLYWGHATNVRLQGRWVAEFEERVTTDMLDEFMDGILPPPPPESPNGHFRSIGLPGFGMSFISKLAMFLCPDVYPVLDTNIARLRNDPFDFAPLRDMRMPARYIPTNTTNERCYGAEWARWCRDVAKLANRELPDLFRIRAADVEGAIFTAVRNDRYDDVKRLLMYIVDRDPYDDMPHDEKMLVHAIRLPSGRVVGRGPYERFAGPLEFTVVAGPRKTALVFLLDRYGLPWTWESSEGVLERTLERFDKRVYEQFLGDHPPEGDGKDQ